MNLEFAELIKNGLTVKQKYLSSKYFYDDYGSQLFQMITKLPEYYLTKCEYEIFETQKDKLLNSFLGKDKRFNLIELGSGDAHKTKILLKHFINKEIDFIYKPIDISSEALDMLDKILVEEFEQLKIEKLVGDYYKVIDKLEFSNNKNVVLFLGSNIGNFNYQESINFLQFITSKIKKNDLFLVGFDLKKEPKIIADAYNDNQGITSLFNLNILTRINNEFGANFDLNNFSHYSYYNPETMECKSYIISNKNQIVSIKSLNLILNFEYAENIYTELSQKFDLERINDIAAKAGLRIKEQFYDCKSYFVDVLFEKI